MRTETFSNPEIYELSGTQYFDFVVAKADDLDEVSQEIDYHREFLDEGYPIQFRYEELPKGPAEPGEFLADVQVGNKSVSVKETEESELFDFAQQVRADNEELDEQIYFGGAVKSTSPLERLRSLLS
ncbi:MAG: hypothetical protein ABEJ64_00225 [Candidatus Nanohaloarchaea archaeon]